MNTTTLDRSAGPVRPGPHAHFVRCPPGELSTPSGGRAPPTGREAIANAQRVDDHGSRPHLQAYWARHAEEVREAQHLRWRVFVDGMGARMTTPAGTLDGYEADRFDRHCEHLIVRAYEHEGDQQGRVVGTYRVMTPDAALRAGGLHGDDAFDLEAVDAMRASMVEVSRACVDPGYRQGAVIMLLCSRLEQVMRDNGLRWMIGSASVTMSDGGGYAASLCRSLLAQHAAPASLRVTPRHALPVDRAAQGVRVEPPPLIRSWLRCGAMILGAPACDARFGCAELPMLLDLQAMASRRQERFD
jgi:putative hemolysin